MSASTKPFSIVSFQDGTCAVVRTDPRKPRLLEVIAIFFDAAHARDYADRENSRSAEPASEPTEAHIPPSFEPPAEIPDLYARQRAVLGALRAKMDANRQVETKAAVLAEAANIPLGSLHSVLQCWKRNSSSKPPAQVPREHPPSTRCCD